MRTTRGQSPMARATGSAHSAKARAGRNSSTVMAMTSGVTFDIIVYLIRAAFAARVSAVCRRQAGAPSNREAKLYCAGRTTASSISA